MSLAPKSSEIDPALAQANQYKGLATPNFYVAMQMKSTIPEGDSSPGMVGAARIYGARRSLAGLVWLEGWRFFARKIW